MDMFSKAKNKFRMILLVMLAFILAVTAGCGGGSNVSNTKGENNSPASSQEQNNNSQSKDDYPNKPVTLIVNYDAGGQTDTIYRAMAKVAEKYLGQPVVVKNVPGGGGTVGIVELSNAKNDGYTLGNTSSAPMTINPHTQNVSYTVDSFDYIGAWGQILTGVLAVNNKPFNNFKELVEYAKTHKGMVFANTQPGGILDFAMQEIIKKEGLDWTSVPMKGLSEGVSTVLGGHADFLVSSVPPTGMDQLKLLMSLSSIRWPSHPDVMTAKELGYELYADARFALAGPAGLPENVRKKWEEVLQKVIKDPEFIEVTKKFNIPIDYLPGEVYKSELHEQFNYFKQKLQK